MRVTLSLPTAGSVRGSAVDKIMGIIIKFEHILEASDVGVSISLGRGSLTNTAHFVAYNGSLGDGRQGRRIVQE